MSNTWAVVNGEDGGEMACKTADLFEVSIGEKVVGSSVKGRFLSPNKDERTKTKYIMSKGVVKSFHSIYFSVIHVGIKRT